MYSDNGRGMLIYGLPSLSIKSCRDGRLATREEDAVPQYSASRTTGGKQLTLATSEIGMRVRGGEKGTKHGCSTDSGKQQSTLSNVFGGQHSTLCFCGAPVNLLSTK